MADGELLKASKTEPKAESNGRRKSFKQSKTKPKKGKATSPPSPQGSLKSYKFTTCKQNNQFMSLVKLNPDAERISHMLD